MSNWFSKHLGIRLDGHTFGNLLRNVAPVAGTLVGGPAGLALAGIAGAGGELARGGNAGSAFRAGLTGAGEAGIGSAAKMGLRGLMSGDEAVGGAPGGVQSISKVPSPGDFQHAVDSLQPSHLSRAGSFLESHPTAVAMGLKGIGDIAQAPAQNAEHSAQARLLSSQAAMAEDERKRRNQMQEALDPLRIALAGQLNAPKNALPPNPYVPVAGV